MECPLCYFHLLFVAIVVTFIVVVNHPSGRDWYVITPLGTIICLQVGGAGVGGMYFAECHLCDFTLFFVVFCCRAHSCWESPLGKGWIGLNPSGHYHLHPDRRSRRGLSCLSPTFLSFLSS